jgi:hypothetical protein
MAFRHIALLLVAIILFLPVPSFSQPADSLLTRHSPAKASLLSAVLPGAGQVYNRKYWKVPVIYAAFAGLGYLAKWNHDRYDTFRSAYRFRVDGNPETTDDFTDLYSENDLKLLRDYYRRNRDLSLIFAGLVYVLNIVDASVDAHLFHFDVSDNLSMNLTPTVVPFAPKPLTGINLGFKF